MSTPIVVEPPNPKSSRTRSGTPASINVQKSCSVIAVPITSALGISWRKISSVPFSSSLTSSTMITLNFLSSIFHFFGSVKYIVKPPFLPGSALIRHPRRPANSSWSRIICLHTRYSVPYSSPFSPAAMRDRSG